MAKLIVTGGGTGGHVFPALEVAREMDRQGCSVEYWGSLRGQESKACDRAAIEFRGFGSEPLYRLTSVRGLRGVVNLLKAMMKVRRQMEEYRPAAVFSTGGYASAPVVGSARKLKIPYVIHEQNVVPGRTNRILGRSAHAVCTVFCSGHEHFEGTRVIRTGMPIRPEFRSGQAGFGIAQTSESHRSLILVTGGSQGAQAINEAAIATATRMARHPIHWIHVTGPRHYEAMIASLGKLGAQNHYTLRAYLDAPEMAGAMFASEVAMCRSGAGTLAELAALRKPSLLIPYPHAFGDHQRANAQEFVEMGAATMLAESELQPSTIESRLMAWIGESDRIGAAQKALADWDSPNAVHEIAKIVMEAAGARMVRPQS
ncbi:MAG: undecaprenyldiphospho-muramoylpentapeptide beta-N-acetylglucosaminyltransferase [Chthonomonas sp.]|nr:undecaprenyldiphospho-muramoylpentapeptide beta-N-acetylglucosaminyltransferase [Chthonomonas sp.]